MKVLQWISILILPLSISCQKAICSSSDAVCNRGAQSILIQQLISSTPLSQTPSVDLFVAVGNSGSIWWTTNGTTVNSALFTSTQPTNHLKSVAYGNGRFVAVGENATVLYSTDGKTWITTSCTGCGNFTDVAFGNGIFLASTATGIRRTVDGITWSQNTNYQDQNFTSITKIRFGSGIFLIIDNASNSSYSTGATAWSSNIAVGATNTSMAYNGSYFVALRSGGANVFNPSTYSWSAVTNPGAYTFTDGIYGNALAVFVASGGNIVFTRDSGTTYSTFTAQCNSENINSIAYGKGMFIGVGANQDTCLNTDGAAAIWTRQGTTAGPMNKIIYVP